ncbi:hypothetical protein NQ176_g1863 [Zarea fungicola]|uniref:Uncharacterized protein n=1 Tax=Zarea fungicola TaxID=93591 RepID=A0ACC1NS03_9HYPO|nr:hypothetical protein NQ176_g1863 [Lecanicillium fungicola]
MAPPAKALKDALIQGTCDVFKLDPDTTSVNKVRRHVEEQLGLDEGFFAGDSWKQSSKEIIKEYVGKLLDGWTPDARIGNTTASKAANKKNAKVVDSDQDGGDVQMRDSSSPKRKRRRMTTDDTNVEDGEKYGEKSKIAENTESKSPEPNGDEEEEYSDVIDEPATSKRKKTRKEPGQKTSKAPKFAKMATKKSGSAAEPTDPQEAEIKKLQSQLTKCGVRKLWHHELKDCHDARSKIRHLKKMLADIGMEGRFSEAKAREIKETRELLADAEAAQEMDRLWGKDSGRSSRNKSRGIQIVENDDSDAENGKDNHSDEGDDDYDEKGAQNVKGKSTTTNDDDEDSAQALYTIRAPYVSPFFSTVMAFHSGTFAAFVQRPGSQQNADLAPRATTPSAGATLVKSPV